MAVYFAVLEPGDTILSLRLATAATSRTGSRSTSRAASTRSSTTASRARRTSSTTTRCSRSRRRHRPKLIVCGGSAYPRTVETRPLPRRSPTRSARSCSATWRTSPGSSPPGCTRTRSSTATSSPRRRTRRSPARARASSSAARSTRRRSTAPSSRGCRAGRSSTRSPRRRRASGSPPTEPFREYQAQVRANADALADDAADGGLDVLTGGTDTHLLLSRPAPSGVDGQGRRGAARRGQAHRQPQHRPVRRAAADRRLRAPARHPGATMRGFDEDDFREVGRIICERARRRRRPRRAGSPGRGALREAPALRRASAATRRTRVSRATPHRRRRTRWSSTSSATCATRTTPTFPPARERAHAPAHLRGDEGPADRGGRDRDAARADDGAADLRQEGRRLPGAAGGRRHARRRALARLERARRLHRPLPQRGDARARRVLREAPRRPGRAGRDRARPDARDRQLERAPRSRR